MLCLIKPVVSMKLVCAERITSQGLLLLGTVSTNFRLQVTVSYRILLIPHERTV